MLTYQGMPSAARAFAICCLATVGCVGPVHGVRSPRATVEVEIDGLVEVDRAARAALGAVEADWIDGVHEQIHAPWSLDVVPGLLGGDPRLHAPEIQVRLEITVEPDGRIDDVTLLERSQVTYLDERARATFANLGSLPPPPLALHSDDGLTRLHWRLARDSRGCGAGEARVRRVLDPLDAALTRLVRSGRVGEAATRLADEIEGGADPDTQVRRLAREILYSAAETHTDMGARAAAVLALGRSGDRRAVPLLARLLRFANRDSACAAGLLADLDARETIPTLEAALRRNHPATNAQVALALKSLGRPEAASLLAPALRDRHPEARLAALQAMAAVPSTTQTGAVVALLADPFVEVRLAAIRLLGDIGGAAAAASLVRHLAQPNPAERAAALDALGRAGQHGAAVRWATVAALHDDSVEVRAAAMAALVRVAPDGAMNEIYRGFKESSPAVLLAAAPALGEVGGPDARDVLTKILRVRQDPRLRAAAAAALEHHNETPRAKRRVVRAPELVVAVSAGRGLDAVAARSALDALTAAHAERRIALAARQLPLRHACTAPLDAPSAPREECARAAMGTPACARKTAAAPSAVTLAAAE
ncbi:MAG: TonB family protein [Deltaproteobacteria bacterium]|nr:TonB family protein [Deltaproteobacteria bacterium]